jgi:hypothetical protein
MHVNVQSCPPSSTLHAQYVRRTNRNGLRMTNKCMNTYILVQRDAVVHDPIFKAKGERIAANVPKNAMKEGASILLVQIPLGLAA